MRDYSSFETPLAHPGEHLREDFLPQYELTPGALAKAMGLKDRTRVERLVREKQPITADTALRLGRVFGTTADFWINLQTAHDLSKAAIEARDALSKIQPVQAPALAWTETLLGRTDPVMRERPAVPEEDVDLQPAPRHRPISGAHAPVQELERELAGTINESVVGKAATVAEALVLRKDVGHAFEGNDDCAGPAARAAFSSARRRRKPNDRTTS